MCLSVVKKNREKFKFNISLKYHKETRLYSFLYWISSGDEILQIIIVFGESSLDYYFIHVAHDYNTYLLRRSRLVASYKFQIKREKINK